jgi:hypothetical protein
VPFRCSRRKIQEKFREPHGSIYEVQALMKGE